MQANTKSKITLGTTFFILCFTLEILSSGDNKGLRKVKSCPEIRNLLNSSVKQDSKPITRMGGFTIDFGEEEVQINYVDSPSNTIVIPMSPEVHNSIPVAPTAPIAPAALPAPRFRCKMKYAVISTAGTALMAASYWLGRASDS